MANCVSFFLWSIFLLQGLVRTTTEKKCSFGKMRKKTSHSFFWAVNMLVRLYEWRIFEIQCFVHHFWHVPFSPPPYVVTSLTSFRLANSHLMNEYSEACLIYDLHSLWLKRKCHVDFTIHGGKFIFVLFCLEITSTFFIGFFSCYSLLFAGVFFFSMPK